MQDVSLERLCRPPVVEMWEGATERRIALPKLGHVK